MNFSMWLRPKQVKQLRTIDSEGTMGHYQEDGIGVKGFTSDRGSIPKEPPETPRAQPEGSRGAPEGCSRGHEEIPRPMTDFDNVILYLQILWGSVAQLVKCWACNFWARVQIPVTPSSHSFSITHPMGYVKIITHPMGQVKTFTHP